jgi:drug/metabolite transporter (DMT)-like permease
VEYLGEICALSAALVWSFSVILFKSSEAVSPTAMNLFKNVVATALLAATVLVLGIGIDWQRPLLDWAALIASGVLGIAVADTLLFVALRRLGAARLAVCECAYAPSIVFLSVVFLSEPITMAFLVGGVLVVGGVTLATTERRPVDPTQPAPEADGVTVGNDLTAVVAGVMAMITMAVGVILTKPVLERGHLVEVTLVRTAAGVAGQLVFIGLRPRHREAFGVFRQRRVWRTLLPGSILGTYVAMLFWLGGFKWADASVAAVLNQLSSVFTIGLAWLILGEQLTGRRTVGALAAVGGAVLVILTGA